METSTLPFSSVALMMPLLLASSVMLMVGALGAVVSIRALSVPCCTYVAALVGDEGCNVESRTRGWRGEVRGDCASGDLSGCEGDRLRGGAIADGQDITCHGIGGQGYGDIDVAAQFCRVDDAVVVGIFCDADGGGARGGGVNQGAVCARCSGVAALVGDEGCNGERSNQRLAGVKFAVTVPAVI